MQNYIYNYNMPYFKVNGQNILLMYHSLKKLEFSSGDHFHTIIFARRKHVVQSDSRQLVDLYPEIKLPRLAHKHIS